MKHSVLLLSFDPLVGWRVRAQSFSKFGRLGVVKLGSIKLLRIPTDIQIRNGRFCNPRKILGV